MKSMNHIIGNLNEVLNGVFGWTVPINLLVLCQNLICNLGKVWIISQSLPFRVQTTPTRFPKKAGFRFLPLTFAIWLGLKKSGENWNVSMFDRDSYTSVKLRVNRLIVPQKKLSFEFASVEFYPQPAKYWLTHAQGGAFKMFFTVVTQHKLQSLVTTNLSKLCLPNPTWQTLPRTRFERIKS